MEIQNRQKKYSKEFKPRIAFDAIKGQKTIGELASEYRVWETEKTCLYLSISLVYCQFSII
jgi:hypothetical protein